MEKFLLDFLDFNIELDSKILKVKYYTSIDLSANSYIVEYLNSLDKSYFEYIKVLDNTTIEKATYDYYKTTDYYDLILFLNSREMLYDMSYSWDVLSENIEKEISDYEYKVFGNTKTYLSDKARDRLKEKLTSKYNAKNTSLYYIKVIKNDYINQVKREIYDLLENHKDMVNLTNSLGDEND